MHSRSQLCVDQVTRSSSEMVWVKYDAYPAKICGDSMSVRRRVSVANYSRKANSVATEEHRRLAGALTVASMVRVNGVRRTLEGLRIWMAVSGPSCSYVGMAQA